MYEGTRVRPITFLKSRTALLEEPFRLKHNANRDGHILGRIRLDHREGPKLILCRDREWLRV
jgi:hypothetical protein